MSDEKMQVIIRNKFDVFYNVREIGIDNVHVATMNLSRQAMPLLDYQFIEHSCNHKPMSKLF